MAAGAAEALDVAIEPANGRSIPSRIRHSPSRLRRSAFNRGDLPGIRIYDEDVNFMTKERHVPGIGIIEVGED